MRNRYLLAAILTGFTALPSFAQTTGDTGGGLGTVTTGGGTGTLGGGRSGLGTTGAAGNFQIQQMQQAQQITGSATTGSTLNSTNAFSQYYANPQFQGRAGATGQDGPGGFGTSLVTGGGGGGTGRAVGATGLNPGRVGAGGTTGGLTTASARTGMTGANTVSTNLGGGAGGAGGRGGATGGFGGTAGGFGGGTGGLGGGRAGGLGGAGGFGGNTGGIGGNQSQATVVPLPRPISYTMNIRMPMPQISVPQMQNDLRGIINRSSMISNPQGIDIAMDGNMVILRGTVKDEEEAKTAEGIIRLTPGVKRVKNELKY